jgi:membrane protein implicated in regulation of membrane protease activity
MTSSAEQKRRKTEAAWHYIFGHADPLFILLAGLAVGFGGVFGLVKGDNLTSATLLVLSVVGFSLLQERSLRLDAKKKLDEIGDQLAETESTVKALHSGSPYHVLLDAATWDISAQDGSLAYGTREKKIRFEHNKVLSLYDFAQGDGTDAAAEYSHGKKVDSFVFEGRRYSLIGLGRIYSRGDEIDFCVKRTMRNTFPTSHGECIGVRTLDPTTQLRIDVTWPRDRALRAVRLGITTAAGQSRYEDVTSQVMTRDGRPMYTVERGEPEQGGLTTVEWDWDPLS